jgi:hypothetical protein
VDSLWGERGDQTLALREWLDQVSGTGWVWFGKRLSANDTGATGGHQVGLYVPRELALIVAPELAEQTLNPRRQLQFDLVSHDQAGRINLIYYNNRTVTPTGTRNEFRLTGFGGRSSAVQDPASTGAIVIMAFRPDTSEVSAWLADTVFEEDVIEAVIGPIEPATVVLRLVAGTGLPTIVVTTPADCKPGIETLPPAWSKAYPPGRDLTAEAVSRRPGTGAVPDKRLVDRYECEYGLFQVVETALTLPLIAKGFGTVDAFLSVAQTIANRRKSRAGRSLELHLAAVFDEEAVSYERNQTTEGKRKPDFLFPSGAAYKAGDPTLMLGVKTTVKDRWRQVLDEAARIPEKHLFTLTEGLSEDQFAQMEDARLRLVVPESNVVKFPPTVRPKLLTLTGFIGLVK